MANFTGANVIVASDVTKYQPDTFNFGIASGSTEATNFFSQTTNDILRQLRITLQLTCWQHIQIILRLRLS